MAGRSGTHVAARGQDKHLHYSRGVTVEEMRQASMALMELVPIEPMEVQKGRDLGRGGGGRGRNARGEEMRQASVALRERVPMEPMEVQKGRDLGRDGRGRDRNSDEERATATGS